MMQKSLVTAVLSTPGGRPARDHGRRDKPPRVLVVDDDMDIRQLYAEVLTDCGYRVDTAPDGEAAWKTLYAARQSRDSYDLLITDYNMPKLSGFELVRKLRSARMELPVILASGSECLNVDSLHQAESLHLASILPKPFSPDQLVQTVRAVLRAAKTQAAAQSRNSS